MLDTVFGLPVHPLIVHATVVVVPAAALAVLVSTFWPRFRRWAGWLPLALAAAALGLDPLTTSSGESLERRVGRSALVERHAHLADGLLPWVIFLALAAAALYAMTWWQARHGTDDESRASTRTAATTRDPVIPRWLVVVVSAAALVAAVGTTVQVALIGHSGAEAAWSHLPADRSTTAPVRR